MNGITRWAMIGVVICAAGYGIIGQFFTSAEESGHGSAPAPADGQRHPEPALLCWPTAQLRFLPTPPGSHIRLTSHLQPAATMAAATATDPPSSNGNGTANDNEESLPAPKIDIDNIKQDKTRDFYHRADGVLCGNGEEVTIPGTLTGDDKATKTIALYEAGRITRLRGTTDSNGAWRINVDVEEQKTYEFQAAVVKKKKGPPVQWVEKSGRSDPVKIKISRKRPWVVDVDTSGLTPTTGTEQLRVIFNTNEFEATDAEDATEYAIEPDVDGETVNPGSPEFHPQQNAVVIPVPNIKPGAYIVKVTGLKDWYGNDLLTNNETNDAFERQILMPIGGRLPTVQPGITGPTGPYVSYREYTEPRKVPDGFNPGDHVETRVARLYYFRDAHRVAQIINRHARSYNRAGVDMQRHLADNARTVADQTTDARQHAERQSIIAAQETRRLERQLASAQQLLNGVLQDVEQTLNEQPGPSQIGTPPTEGEVKEWDAELKQRQDAAGVVAARVNALQAQVQEARDEEVRLNETAQQAEARELRSREEQFRREVAAAHADPDTYAPGVPTSDDPVAQVSVSVIGEGLIQLRGPIKGINVIRTMINQIDAPVGQVRVAVHTLQINGEHGDRMEEVADTMQKYIDHSRFLTARSAEMLRNAIVQVASEQAYAMTNLYPGTTQADRDRRYLDAFFGKDFIDELAAMDSEFLGTGNKLLSLHSMDTTSLASALFLLGLAKNSTRLAILERFEGMLASELPMAEESYLQSGLYCQKKCVWPRKPEFCLLAQNARFESLRGFFNREMTYGDDTMTPIQREFIRLAQIFKGRLITEMEWKQRVMERALIEERGGNYREQLKDARDKEDEAKKALAQAQQALSDQLIEVVLALRQIRARIKTIHDTVNKAIELANSIAIEMSPTFLQHVQQLDTLRKILEDRGQEADFLQVEEVKSRLVPSKDESVPQKLLEFQDKVIKAAQEAWGEDYKVTAPPITGHFRFREKRFPFTIEETDEGEGVYLLDAKDLELLGEEVSAALRVARSLPDYLDNFVLSEESQDRMEHADGLLAALEELEAIELASEYREVLKHVIYVYGDIHTSIRAEADKLLAAFDTVLASLSRTDANLQEAYSKWLELKNEILSSTEGSLREEARKLVAKVDSGFPDLLERALRADVAEKNAERSRRPLDHRKFLDMLVDDLEEKYIELLEGTRAHTANVDNYIKRLATALDDDFNTQFYYPAFRGTREASRYWDVTFGQLETTSILANNRAFAKVSPKATMEFDLPERDILINEAINGAKAVMDDVGALINDPSFLALTRAQAGGSTASPAAGSTGGFSTVRNVLPTLPSSTAEDIIPQAQAAEPRFGAAMEALIPDPAIYKFETGTGFEIRPVIQPDGQAVVFHFNYMYSTNIREPVRADEKHLGRVKQHYIDTDVQLSNYELREVSRYMVALKASRTSRGVPLLEDIPVAGVLFRPLPQQEASLQQNMVLAQATIFPTLFDLMGLRWAPAVADLDPLRLSNEEFIVRNRRRALMNRVYDHASSQVDEFLQIPEANRRPDLYRTQETIPTLHPNGYQGPGLDYRDSTLQEGYQPERAYPQQQFVPRESTEGVLIRPEREEGTTIRRMYRDRHQPPRLDLYENLLQEDSPLGRSSSASGSPPRPSSRPVQQPKVDRSRFEVIPTPEAVQ